MNKSTIGLLAVTVSSALAASLIPCQAAPGPAMGRAPSGSVTTTSVSNTAGFSGAGFNAGPGFNNGFNNGNTFDDQTSNTTTTTQTFNPMTGVNGMNNGTSFFNTGVPASTGIPVSPFGTQSPNQNSLNGVSMQFLNPNLVGTNGLINGGTASPFFQQSPFAPGVFVNGGPTFSGAFSNGGGGGGGGVTTQGFAPPSTANPTRVHLPMEVFQHNPYATPRAIAQRSILTNGVPSSVTGAVVVDYKWPSSSKSFARTYKKTSSCSVKKSSTKRTKKAAAVRRRGC